MIMTDNKAINSVIITVKGHYPNTLLLTNALMCRENKKRLVDIIEILYSFKQQLISNKCYFV